METSDRSLNAKPSAPEPASATQDKLVPSEVKILSAGQVGNGLDVLAKAWTFGSVSDWLTHVEPLYESTWLVDGAVTDTSDKSLKAKGDAAPPASITHSKLVPLYVRIWPVSHCPPTRLLIGLAILAQSLTVKSRSASAFQYWPSKYRILVAVASAVPDTSAMSSKIRASLGPPMSATQVSCVPSNVNTSPNWHLPDVVLSIGSFAKPSTIWPDAQLVPLKYKISCAAGKAAFTSDKSFKISVPDAILSKEIHFRVEPSAIKTSPPPQDANDPLLRAKSLTPLMTASSIATSSSRSELGLSWLQTIWPPLSAHHLPETSAPTDGSASSTHDQPLLVHVSFCSSLHVGASSRACAWTFLPPMTTLPSTRMSPVKATWPSWSILKEEIHPSPPAWPCLVPSPPTPYTKPSAAQLSRLSARERSSLICDSCLALAVSPLLPPDKVKKRCCASASNTPEKVVNPRVSSKINFITNRTLVSKYIIAHLPYGRLH